MDGHDEAVQDVPEQPKQQNEKPQQAAQSKVATVVTGVAKTRVPEPNEEQPDVMLVCRICNAHFEFTVGEQKFYHEKGYFYPEMCEECRISAREERDAKRGARNAKQDAPKRPTERRNNIEPC